MDDPAPSPAAARGRRPDLDPVTERRRLLKAALAVMHRSDRNQVTLNEILRESRLSTRAFYRQFESVSEIVTVLKQDELARVCTRLEKATATASTPLGALESWIDELLGIRYDPRRTRRASVLRDNGNSDLQSRTDVVRTLAANLQPILELGAETGDFPRADPHRDAWMICVITMEFLATTRGALPPIARPDARNHVLRFAVRAMT